VVEELSKLGIKTVPETARALIDAKLWCGIKLEAIRSDEAGFQRELFELKFKIENELDPNQKIALDRALPDSIAYFKAAKLDPAPIIEKCSRFKYAKVFIFDRLALKSDYARTENEDRAAWLDLELEKDYRALGLDVVRVPLLAIKERTKIVRDFILSL